MTEHMKKHVLDFLKQDKRLDLRKLDEYRAPVTVEYGISNTAEGSARVQIGDTVVLAGVKLSIMTPYPDTPNEGGIMVNTELIPFSNPRFDPGPPSIESIELARVIDRGIRESKAIDVKKLVIEKGEKVWSVSIDLIPINYDGNLMDAFSLAAIAALQDARFPKYSEEDGLDYRTKTEESLPLEKEPIAVTVYKIGDKLLVDPTLIEEKVADARLTVTTVADGTISALQKGGIAPLTIDDVDNMAAIAIEKAKELRTHLKK